MHVTNIVGLKRIGVADTLLIVDRKVLKDGSVATLKAKGWAHCASCRKRRPHKPTLDCATHKA